jgi:hypothetical protein
VALRVAQTVALPTKPLPPGQRVDPIRIDPGTLRRLVPAAAGRALGQPPDRVTEVIWSEGGDELSIDPAKLDLRTVNGIVVFALPVRCDQSGQGIVQIPLAVGAPDQGAGMFAAAPRRPIGPRVVVDRWGDALVALAWGTLVELVNQVAASAGRDDNGDPLIPGSIEAADGTLVVTPYARHPLGPLLK